MKSWLVLGISIIINIGLILFIYIQRQKTAPPPFDPFHIKTNFNYSDLISDGYTPVPVDVLMLGKTVGNLTMHYQIDEETKEVFWRQAIIDTKMKQVDTLGIYNLIESYQADILLTDQMNDKKMPPPLTPRFLVKHRINNQIFECFLEETRENQYEITVSLESPLTDSKILEQKKEIWLNRSKQFGPDTTVYENGETSITNFWNWTSEGEDKLIRPNGTLETLRFFKNGELQNTKGYYEDGTIEYDVLSYNMTGSSIWWYPNGAIKEVVHYKHGRRSGEHITYYSNGKVKSTGQYSGGFYDTGVKDGEWTNYDSLGHTKGKEFYRQDSLLKTVHY